MGEAEKKRGETVEKGKKKTKKKEEWEENNNKKKREYGAKIETEKKWIYIFIGSVACEKGEWIKSRTEQKNKWNNIIKSKKWRKRE